jgi:malate/lactate dehydrogenase
MTDIGFSRHHRIAIIGGAGSVGSGFAFSLIAQTISNEILLVYVAPDEGIWTQRSEMDRLLISEMPHQ